MENMTLEEDGTINIFIPFKIKRSRGKTTVIIPEGTISPTRANYDHKLINALVKAYKWQKQIDKQEITIERLAEKEKLDTRYVSRILRFNYLAPDIVAAILEGKQPRTLCLQDLMYVDIPELWEEQRKIINKF